MEQPESQADRPEREGTPDVPDGAVQGAAEPAVPDGAVSTPSGLEVRRRPWLLVGGVVVLAAAAVLLGGLYVDADGDRRDQRRRVADLTAQEAESARQATASQARVVELEKQLDTERARFTAVEPCLRQVASPAPVEVISDAEYDRLVAEAMRNLPTRPGKTVRLGELTLSGAALPACKDVGRHLK